jgi:hypothetical protein
MQLNPAQIFCGLIPSFFILILYVNTSSAIVNFTMFNAKKRPGLIKPQKISEDGDQSPRRLHTMHAYQSQGESNPGQL